MGGGRLRFARLVAVLTIATALLTSASAVAQLPSVPWGHPAPAAGPSLSSTPSAALLLAPGTPVPPDPSNGAPAGVLGLLGFGTNTLANGIVTGGTFHWINLYDPVPVLYNVPLPPSPIQGALATYFPTNQPVMGAPIQPDTDDQPHLAIVGTYTCLAGVSSALPGRGTFNHARSHLHPLNTPIASLNDDRPPYTIWYPRAVVAAPTKQYPHQTGVSLFDFRTMIGSAPQQPQRVYVPPTALLTGNPAACPPRAEHVLSVINSDISNPAYPLAFAWITGSQFVGDYSTGGLFAADTNGFPASYGPCLLRLVDVGTPLSSTSPPPIPPVASYALGVNMQVCGPWSPYVPGRCWAFSPYASEFLVWPRRAPGTSHLSVPSQSAYVPLSGGVEIVDLSAPLTPASFVRVILPPPGYEIASNVEWFGPDPVTGEDTFIVLARPTLPGASAGGHHFLPYGSGLRFVVFDRAGNTRVGSFGWADAAAPSYRPIDINRGEPRIVVVPPEENTYEQGPWYTAFVCLYDSGGWPMFPRPNPFGVVASIENVGVTGSASYTDGGLPYNTPSTYPVRYHAPVGLPGGLLPTAVVPMGCVAAVPPADLLGTGFTPSSHPNYVAWYFGSEIPNTVPPPPVIRPQGVCAFDVNSLPNGLEPGWKILSGGFNPEPVVRSPLWGYVNDTCTAFLYAQSAQGIEGFTVSPAPGLPSLLSVTMTANRIAQAPNYDIMKRRHATFMPPPIYQGTLTGMLPSIALTDVGLAQMENLATRGLGIDNYVAYLSRWPATPCGPPGAINTAAFDANTVSPGIVGLTTVPEYSPLNYALPVLPSAYYMPGASTLASYFVPPMTPYPGRPFQFLVDFTISPVATGSPLSPTQWVANGGSMRPRFNVHGTLIPSQDAIVGAVVEAAAAPTAPPIPQLTLSYFRNIAPGTFPTAVVLQNVVNHAVTAAPVTEAATELWSF